MGAIHGSISALLIGLSDMKSCKETSVDAFKEALAQSLTDMHDLCVSQKGSSNL